MNRLALIVATGFLALSLTACGENGNKPAPTTTTETTVTTQPAQDQTQPQPAPENTTPDGQNH
ncbi:MAG: hypothetical protein HYX60_11535 [Legionella longbeachae]|nr:hypothetical protein [Legionella longbeachae]